MLTAEDGFDIGDRLDQLSVPTLLCCGARDYFYGVELFVETARRIPDARLCIYPRAGHGVVVKREFFRDVLAFVR